MKKFIYGMLIIGISAAALTGCRQASVSGQGADEVTAAEAESGETENQADDAWDETTKENREAGTQDEKSENTQEYADKNTQEHADKAAKVPAVMENLHADKSLFTKTFYKAGDMNCIIQPYVIPGEDGDSFSSNTLSLFFTAAEPGIAETEDQEKQYINASAVIETVPGQNVYETELEMHGYRNGERLFETTETVTVSLPADGGAGNPISVRCGETASEEMKAVSGEYYFMDETEDLFQRYLCRAEICAYPSEDLRLMRNTIYAAHGRKFQDPVLTEYMEAKPWYRGSIEPGDFSDDVLSDVEKKNILLLQELENQPFDEREAAYGIESFEPAPYLSLLSQNKETGLSVDMEQAEDCGAYYQVPGTLFLPVSFTRDQWEEVNQGCKAELCMNELTGETWILEYDRDQGYCFYKKGTEPDNFQADIQSSYNYDTGLYELQQLSDDTIMKTVYEGSVYILKGAVCGGMVNITAASELQKEITPDMQSVSGNRLYHNGRGYFTGIYYLGD